MRVCKPLWNKVGNTLVHVGGSFYHVAGLLDYKATPNPEWMPRAVLLVA